MTVKSTPQADQNGNPIPVRRYVCEWCGEEVTKDDYLEIRWGTVYCCGKLECEKELARYDVEECPHCGGEL